MTTWNDFNSAEDQKNLDVIPKGTLVKVRMTIRPGGYDDLSQGWSGGYATQSHTTGSIYLNGEFVVLDGPYAKRKIWSLIGLHSPKGPEWSNMGRAFIKGILNSARGLHPADNSPQAQQARRIQGFADLDGIEFVAKIEMDKDQYDDDKNIIKTAITPDHRDYAGVMGNAPQIQTTQLGQPASTPANNQPTAATGRPSWAQ